MHYQIKLQDLPIRENPNLEKFVKQYPKTKIFRLELDNNWRPENFEIKRFEVTDKANLKLIRLPVDTELIPVYEISESLQDKVNNTGLKFKLAKGGQRVLSKILPSNVNMSHLTPNEMSDLLNEILQKKTAIDKRVESTKKLEDEMQIQMEDFEKDKAELESQRQSLHEELNKVLDKEVRLDELTSGVEKMQIMQDEQSRENAQLHAQMQNELNNLQFELNESDLQRKDCEEKLLASEPKGKELEIAQAEILRLQTIIDEKNSAENNPSSPKTKGILSKINPKNLFGTNDEKRVGENSNPQSPVNRIPPVPVLRSTLRSSRPITDTQSQMTKVNNTDTRNWDKNFDELGGVPQQTNHPLVQRTNITGNYDPHHFGSGSMRLEIPQLDTSSPEKLELFLDCFTSITQFFPPDDIKKLILNTLIKNHQMELIPFLTDEILSSVDQFAEFLRQSYSSDEVVLRKQFDQIVQTDQDALRYFRLIFRSYYTSKKKVPPKDYKQIMSETERADISYKFISTLKDNRLREKLFLEDIKFSDLPKKAAKFEEILKRSNPENKIFNVVAKVECELCGSKSHDSESCLASDKNKRHTGNH